MPRDDAISFVEGCLGDAFPSPREELLRRFRRMREEIAQIFRDVAHWNKLHPQHDPIDADPDGSMAACAAWLDHMIAHGPEAISTAPPLPSVEP